jgi:hypothetical protein
MLHSISKTLAGTAIGLVALLVGSAPAHAVPVNVTYNMNYSYVSPAAGVPVLYGPGTLTVQFSNGTSGAHVGAGALHVVSGSAMLNNTFSLFGGAIAFTGMQHILFGGSGMGAVTGGGLFNLATVGHIASGMVHCGGGACGLAGFVTSANVNLTSGLRTLNLNNIANALLGFPSVGPQNFVAQGTGGATPNMGVFQVTVTGQEVSRGVVPEPGTGSLLGLGLAGLGIATTTWRRVRRARA